MPELPEVQTTVNGLQSKVLNRTFVDVWSDWEKTVKKPKDFKQFKKELVGKKIVRVWRRAKNVIFELSDGYSLLVHMKMTGHLLVSTWTLKNNTWMSDKKGFMEDSMNGYLHTMWMLDDGQMIALSDLRKFAKVELWRTNELMQSKDFLGLGPEPLENNFTVEKLTEVLKNKKGKIKQVLMVPEVIAGIGNIYASESLWWAKIHPERAANSLSQKELVDLYHAIIKVLKVGIDCGGESFSDYRNVNGQKGQFGIERKAYKREKQPCFRCSTPIKRIMFGGRSAFFCETCQTLKS